MLKHVQISPLRNRADSVSLRSSISCASSLCGSPEPPGDPMRPVSRASSYCSLSEGQSPPQTTIKIYTACLRIDIEYKTLGIQWDTTSKEVVAQLLRRCKLRQRDPRLFYLSMEVTMRRAGVKTLLALDDAARPATLQACHPKGDSRICLQMRAGGLIKVHTSVLQPTSQYKSLLIAEETTADELLQLLLASYNSLEAVEQFSIYEVCPGQEYQRKLHPDDQPLRAQQQRTQKGEACHFLVRRNPHYPRRKQILAPIIETNTSCHSLSSLAQSMGSSCSIPSVPPPSPSTKTGNTTDAVCKMCKNHFRSCEFCNKNSEQQQQLQSFQRTPQPPNYLPQHSHHSTTTTSSSSSNASIARHSICGSIGGEFTVDTYNPVYNVREIRTACHSFSSLGVDKKLLDMQLHGTGTAAPKSANNHNRNSTHNNHAETAVATETTAALGAVSTIVRLTSTAATANTATVNRGSVVMEAVHNDPANGFGKFVYI